MIGTMVPELNVTGFGFRVLLGCPLSEFRVPVASVEQAVFSPEYWIAQQVPS